MCYFIISAQEQDSKPGQGFDLQQSFGGEITQVNFWSTALDDIDIKTDYKCKKIDKKPDILSWENSNWQLLGKVIERNVSEKEICQDKQLYRILIFSELSEIERSVEHCRMIGSSIAVPQSNDSNNELLKVAKTFKDKCGPRPGVWIGLQDYNEGIWQNIVTNITQT